MLKEGERGGQIDSIIHILSYCYSIFTFLTEFGHFKKCRVWFVYHAISLTPCFPFFMASILFVFLKKFYITCLYSFVILICNVCVKGLCSLVKFSGLLLLDSFLTENVDLPIVCKSAESLNRS